MIGLALAFLFKYATQRLSSFGEAIGLDESVSFQLFLAITLLTIIFRVYPLKDLRFFTSLLGLFSLLSFIFGLSIAVTNMHPNWDLIAFVENTDIFLKDAASESSPEVGKLQIPSLKDAAEHLMELDSTGLKLMGIGTISGFFVETALAIGRKDEDPGMMA